MALSVRLWRCLFLPPGPQAKGPVLPLPRHRWWRWDCGHAHAAPAPASYLYYAGLLLVDHVRVLGTAFRLGLVMSLLLLILYVCSLPYQEGLTTAVIVNNLFFDNHDLFGRNRGLCGRETIGAPISTGWSHRLIRHTDKIKLALLNAELEEKHRSWL